MMKTKQPSMSPLDIVILLKIISLGDQPWNQKFMADALLMSQSEISKSLERSRFAGLLDPSGKGTLHGQIILPLYPSVVDAVQKDQKLHELLALIDVLRVGRARKKDIAISELKSRGNDYRTSHDFEDIIYILDKCSFLAGRDHLP